jgi:hypothetical protein
VKGAFILRGEDPDPHQVVLHGARVATVGGGGSRPVPIPPTILDVVPHRDVFVPFELPVSDLDPGWYTLVCDLEIDGTRGTHDGGRRFSVPWPRATIRRGQVPVDREVELGRATVRLGHVDCSGDSIRLHLRVEPPGGIGVKLDADGRRLDLLELELDETTGKVRATAYPLLRSDQVLRIQLRGRGRGVEAAVDVPLP